MQRYVCEFRAVEAEGTGVRGHASVFGQVAQIRNSFEQIDPKAFDRALAEKQPVLLLVNHEGLPLASTENGTLRLGTDDVGLTVDADLADTQLGRDVRALLARGDLRSMSFGFIPKADRIDSVNGHQVRTITDLDLFDVSIVGMPAYAGTDVALRQFDPADAPAFPARLIRAKSRLLIQESK